MRNRDRLNQATNDAHQHAGSGEGDRLEVAAVSGKSAAARATLDVERPLYSLGLDSLIAVELKNHIEKLRRSCQSHHF
jgi:hypothetical protein